MRSLTKQLQTPSAQSGVALVVSLIFLLILTLLGLSSSNVSVLQERMASNVSEYNIAFQRAEATIREIENELRQVNPNVANIYEWGDIGELINVNTGVNDCSLEANFGDDWSGTDAQLGSSAIEWQTAPLTTNEYIVIELSQYADSAANPRISCRQEQGLTFENGVSAEGEYYLILARAYGPGDESRRAQAVIQSVFWWPR